MSAGSGADGGSRRGARCRRDSAWRDRAFTLHSRRATCRPSTGKYATDAPSDRLISGRASRHRKWSSNTIGAFTRRSSLQPPHPPAARMMAAVAAGVGGADCLWRSRPLTKGRSGTAGPEAGAQARNKGEERSRSRGRSPTWTRQGRAPGRSPKATQRMLREPRSGIALASAIP